MIWKVPLPFSLAPLSSAPPSLLLLSRIVSLSPGSELENSVEVRSTQTHILAEDAC